MIAIMTKYIGPTNTNGSRIKAYTCNKGQSVTIPYNYSLSGEALFKEAALALMAKLDWKGEIIGGGTKEGYCFVFTGK